MSLIVFHLLLTNNSRISILSLLLRLDIARDQTKTTQNIFIVSKSLCTASRTFWCLLLNQNRLSLGILLLFFVQPRQWGLLAILFSSSKFSNNLIYSLVELFFMELIWSIEYNWDVWCLILTWTMYIYIEIHVFS